MIFTKTNTPGDQIPPQAFHCHQALEPCRCLAVDAATDPDFRRGPKLGQQSFDARSSEEKWDAFASVKSSQIIHLKPTVTQEEKDVVTEYQIANMYIYIYIYLFYLFIYLFLHYSCT